MKLPRWNWLFRALQGLSMTLEMLYMHSTYFDHTLLVGLTFVSAIWPHVWQ